MFKLNEDTITSIATAHGVGAVGIIRVSGNKAFDICGRIFTGKKTFDNIKSHTINYGKIIDPTNGEVLDEVLLSKMKAPNTFTREDIVEINCHGGLLVLKRVLELIVKEGARLAEPGEFTKRAFLNGRIDLSQAEAVIDIINSKTSESSKAALDQLEGKLSRKLKDVRQNLIKLIAHIEVTVDYPEHDIEEITGNMVYEEITIIKDKLQKIIAGFEKGRIIREGLNLVILGRPNVGKSSLLNELSGKNKAIVTDIPGTTRDIIEEYVNIAGVPVKIIDTAGIRETEDVVEKIGVEKAKKAIEVSDLILFMIDANIGVTDEDLQIYEEIKEKKVLVLLNKIDLADKNTLMGIEDKFSDRKVIKTSLKEDVGLNHLEDFIKSEFLGGGIGQNSEILVTNIRHKSLIEEAIRNIDQAKESHEGQMPLDMVTMDIKSAAESLGQITGESVSEDVMKEIFARFCIGK